MNQTISIDKTPAGFPVKTNHEDYEHLKPLMSVAGHFNVYKLTVLKSNLMQVVSAFLFHNTKQPSEKMLLYVLCDGEPGTASRLCVQQTKGMDDELSQWLVYAVLERLKITYEPSDVSYFRGG